MYFIRAQFAAKGASREVGNRLSRFSMTNGFRIDELLNL